MSLGSKIIVAIVSILMSSFSPEAKAQLASDKPLAKMYNEKINEKLAEKNKPGIVAKPLQKDQALPSERSSLSVMAKSKIKNSGIVAHDDSIQSIEEKKRKLPSNSAKLKQIATINIKSRTSIVH